MIVVAMALARAALVLCLLCLSAGPFSFSQKTRLFVGGATEQQAPVGSYDEYIDSVIDPKARRSNLVAQETTTTTSSSRHQLSRDATSVGQQPESPLKSSSRARPGSSGSREDLTTEASPFEDETTTISAAAAAAAAASTRSSSTTRTRRRTAGDVDNDVDGNGGGGGRSSGVTRRRSVDYACLHRSSWQVNTDNHFNAPLSVQTDVTSSYFSSNVFAWNVLSSRVPNYDRVFSSNDILALNGRSSVVADFVNALTTTAKAGQIYSFGQDLGYKKTTCSLGYWPPGSACPVSAVSFQSYILNPLPETTVGGCYVPPGDVGTFVNGVKMFGWGDGTSHKGKAVWHKVAAFYEASDLDPCGGKASSNGDYHHFAHPPCLMAKLHDVGVGHSPVYGFVNDGYPIYGPFNGPNTLSASCWKKRDYSNSLSGGGCDSGTRSCLLVDPWDLSQGTVNILDPTLWGPSTTSYVSNANNRTFMASSGAFFEDYYFDVLCPFQTGTQFLDEHNGHDHDNLGYHYHVTLTRDEGPVFPFLVGPQFYGCLFATQGGNNTIAGSCQTSFPDTQTAPIVTPSRCSSGPSQGVSASNTKCRVVPTSAPTVSAAAFTPAPTKTVLPTPAFGDYSMRYGGGSGSGYSGGGSGSYYNSGGHYSGSGGRHGGAGSVHYPTPVLSPGYSLRHGSGGGGSRGFSGLLHSNAIKHMPTGTAAPSKTPTMAPTRNPNYRQATSGVPTPANSIAPTKSGQTNAPVFPTGQPTSQPSLPSSAPTTSVPSGGGIRHNFRGDIIPIFSLQLLSTNSHSIDVEQFLGLDGGGLAISNHSLLVSGDGMLVEITDRQSLLTGPGSGMKIFNGSKIINSLTSNLATGDVFALADTNMMPLTGPGTVSFLLAIDSNTTRPKATGTITLNIPIPLGYHSGIFPGYNRLVLVDRDSTNAWNIDLSSGHVIYIGNVLPKWTYANNWAIWGIAECSEQLRINLIYGAASGGIERQMINDHGDNNLVPWESSYSSETMFDANMGVIAALSIDVFNARWYFYYSGSGAFGTGYAATLGYADCVFLLSLPSSQPTSEPTQQPFSSPTSTPSDQPTGVPSGQPSGVPTMQPTLQPTGEPTSQPVFLPTSLPTTQPSSEPSSQPVSRPTKFPTNQPSGVPTMQPSQQPTGEPTGQPTSVPTQEPTGQPSSLPTTLPTSVPSTIPTSLPSAIPSTLPTGIPTCPPITRPTTPPSSQPSGCPTVLPTAQPTGVPTSRPTNKPYPLPTPEPSPKPICPPTSVPSQRPTSHPTGRPTSLPTSHPTSLPTSSPTKKATPSPSFNPTGGQVATTVPSSMPTTSVVGPMAAPTPEPTAEPTVEVTVNPTPEPTFVPTGSGWTRYPTTVPTSIPTSIPTGKPSSHPTTIPSSLPTSLPSLHPTGLPTSKPTGEPTSSPSLHPPPTPMPSMVPSSVPSRRPSSHPTSIPTQRPTGRPTSLPSQRPTSLPSVRPLSRPSSVPSQRPTSQPTGRPTSLPSGYPTRRPTSLPTSRPTGRPTSLPTTLPTGRPTSLPTTLPTSEPSRQPTSQPTRQPTGQPTRRPTKKPVPLPTRAPTPIPTRKTNAPIAKPTRKPTGQPTSIPTQEPSTQPSSMPSGQPSKMPTSRPTMQPTGQPTMQPSRQPVSRPTNRPTSIPTHPSSQPTGRPSGQPTVSPTFSPSPEPLTEAQRATATVTRIGVGVIVVINGITPTQFGTVVSGAPFANLTLVQKNFVAGFAATLKIPSSAVSLNSAYRRQLDSTTTSTAKTTVSLTYYEEAVAKAGTSVSYSIAHTTNSSIAKISTAATSGSLIDHCFPASSTATLPAGTTLVASAPKFTVLKPVTVTFAPSPSPTFAPTTALYAPGMNVTNIIPGKTFIDMYLGIFSRDGKGYSGSVYCAAYDPLSVIVANIAGSGTSSGSQVKATGISIGAYSQFSCPAGGNVDITVRIPGLKAVSPYYPYCFVQTTNPKIYSRDDQVGKVLLDAQFLLASQQRQTADSVCDVATPSILQYSPPILAPNPITCAWKTTCCKDITVGNAPTAVFGQVSKYYGLSGNLYLYEFTLSSPPSNYLTITPTFSLDLNYPVPAADGDVLDYKIRDVNNQYTFMVANPPSITFLPGATSTSALTGKFYITAMVCNKPASDLTNNLPSECTNDGPSPLSIEGNVLVDLSLSGDSASFGVIGYPRAVQILSGSSPLPAPKLLFAQFAGSGAFFTATLDAPSNEGNLAGNWKCDKLFSFSGDKTCSCSWLSTSVVKGLFGTDMTVVYPGINGTLTLKSGILQAACPSTSTAANCAKYPYNEQFRTNLLAPLKPVLPTVILSLPVVLGGCDVLIVDASSSAGNGGRAWQSISWQVLDEYGADQTNLEEWLTSNSTITTSNGLRLINTASPIYVPRSQLSTADMTYYFTLTLKNFLGVSNSIQQNFRAAGDRNLPTAKIKGSLSFSITSNQQLLLNGYADPGGWPNGVPVVSSNGKYCVPNPPALSYYWRVYLRVNTDMLLSGTKYASTSLDPRNILLPPYTLEVGNTYVFELVVTPIGYPLSVATTSALVYVAHGNVQAIVFGGYTKSIGTDRILQLDASVSRDYDISPSLPNNMTYFWSCEFADVGVLFGQDCNLVGNLIAGKDATTGKWIGPTKTVFNIMTNASESVQTFLADPTQAVLTIPRNTIDITNGRMYFSVSVASSDGRTSSATVLVTPVLAGAPVLQVTSAYTKFNADATLKLFGYVAANFSVTALWSASYSGTDVPFDPLTPITRTFSLEEAKAVIYFPLAIGPNTFVAGRSYTFLLSAYPKGLPQYTSFGTITMLVNAPPSSGSLVVTPSSGSALETQFVFSAPSWTDDPADYPLLYSFNYFADPSNPPLSLGAGSLAAYQSASLPAGLETYDYVLQCETIVYDIYSAGGRGTSSVISKLNKNANIGALLTSGLGNALSSGNADLTYQTVNNFASTVNVVNCTMPYKTYCADRNRFNCLTTPNHCETCLPGFTGIIGVSNIRCFNVSTHDGEVGKNCTTNDDCRFGLCDAILNVCDAPPLKFPTGIEDTVCSGHGVGQYRDTSNVVQAKCTIYNVFCRAYCVCNPGYSGVDCLLDTAAALARDSARGQMCKALLKTSASQDKSHKLLDSMVSSLLTSYNPDEVITPASKADCAAVLGFMVKLAGSGYLRGTKPATQAFMTKTISSFVSPAAPTTSPTGRRRLDDAGAGANTAVGNMIGGVTKNMVPGQKPTPLATSNVRVAVLASLASDMSHASLNPPSTAAEAAYGTLPPKVGLPGAGLSACGFVGGYANSGVMQFGTNPYPGSSDVKSPILRMSVAAPGGVSTPKRRRRLGGSRRLTESEAELFAQGDAYFEERLLQAKQQRDYNYTEQLGIPKYYISMQFASHQDFNFSFDLVHGTLPVRSKGDHSPPNNFSLPACKLYNAATGTYDACKHCNVSSYTNYNVTFGCYDIMQLCPTEGVKHSKGKGKRRMLLQESPEDDDPFETFDEDEEGAEEDGEASSQRRRLADDDGMANDDGGEASSAGGAASQFGALLAAILAELAAVLTSNPFNVDPSKAIPILTFVSALGFTIILGVFCFLRWDTYDHNYRIYIKKAHAAKMREDILKERLGKKPADVVKEDSGFSFNIAKAFVPRGNAVRADIEKARIKSLCGDDQKSDADSVVYSTTEDSHSAMDDDYVPHEKIEKNFLTLPREEQAGAAEGRLVEFMNAVVPPESLLAKGSLLNRLFWKTIELHDYTASFAKPSIENTRVMRWMVLCRIVLIALFIDTLFFGLFYPENMCENLVMKKMCLTPQSTFGGTTQCVWTKDPDPENAPTVFGGTCALRPPPSSMTFTIMVALACAILSIPVSMFVGFWQDNYCSKRPIMEKIGWNSDRVVGSKSSINAPNGVVQKSALGILLSQVQDSRDGERSAEQAFKDNEFLAHQVYADFISPAEEVNIILEKVKNFLSADLESATLPWASLPAETGAKQAATTSEADAQKILSGRGDAAIKAAKTRAIQKTLGIFPDGTAVPLTIRQWLWFGTPRKRLDAKITKARKKALEISDEVEGFEDEQADYKDTTLVQRFILEQMAPFKRFALEKEFFSFEETPADCHPIPWIIGWIVVCGANAFFVYWILAWGIKSGGTTLANWGVNYGTQSCMDIFAVQIFGILVNSVLAVFTMQPQLHSIRRVLTNIGIAYCQEDSDRTGEIRVVQHMSASCRAARMNSTKNLASATILRHMDDLDIELCRAERSNHGTSYFIFIMVAIPGCIALLNPGWADSIMQNFVNMFVASFILLNQSLYDADGQIGIIVSIPYLILAGYLGYVMGILRPAKKKFLESGGSKSLTRQWSQSKRSRDKQTFWGTIKSYMAEWGDYLLRLSIYFSLDSPWLARKANHAADWQRMNLPAALQGYVLSEQEMERSSFVFETSVANKTTSTNNSLEGTTSQILSLLPVQILKMRPSELSKDWIEKRSTIDKWLHSTMGATEANPTDEFGNEYDDATLDANSRVVYRNVPRKGPNAMFRNKTVTMDASVACQRMLQNHVGDALTSDEDFSYLTSLVDASRFDSFIYLPELLAMINKSWDNFYPFGELLTAEHREEFQERFLIWVQNTQGSKAQGVRFDVFRLWFIKECALIRKIREDQMTKQYVPPEDLVEKAAVAALKAARIAADGKAAEMAAGGDTESSDGLSAYDSSSDGDGGAAGGGAVGGARRGKFNIDTSSSEGYEDLAAKKKQEALKKAKLGKTGGKLGGPSTKKGPAIAGMAPDDVDDDDDGSGSGSDFGLQAFMDSSDSDSDIDTKSQKRFSSAAAGGGSGGGEDAGFSDDEWSAIDKMSKSVDPNVLVVARQRAAEKAKVPTVSLGAFGKGLSAVTNTFGNAFGSMTNSQQVAASTTVAAAARTSLPPQKQAVASTKAILDEGADNVVNPLVSSSSGSEVGGLNFGDDSSGESTEEEIGGGKKAKGGIKGLSLPPPPRRGNV